jgi:hypothetical protein
MQEYQIRYMNPENTGRAKRSKKYTNPWVTIFMAQRIAAENQIEAYIWEDDINVLTVHSDGRVVVTL